MPCSLGRSYSGILLFPAACEILMEVFFFLKAKNSVKIISLPWRKLFSDPVIDSLSTGSRAESHPWAASHPLASPCPASHCRLGLGSPPGHSQEPLTLFWECLTSESHRGAGECGMGSSRGDLTASSRKGWRWLSLAGF